MRIAVISDIHGNGVALDAVVADVSHNPVDAWVCVGDAVQGGAQPLEVAERLAELDCSVILGNADAFVLDGVSAEAIAEQHHHVRTWTLEILGRRGTDLVRSYAPTLEVDLDGYGKMLCFHGTPGSFDGVLAPSTTADELRKQLGGHAARLMCGGHIHRQWMVSLDDWTFFNPGSVGMAYNFHVPEIWLTFTRSRSTPSCRSPTATRASSSARFPTTSTRWTPRPAPADILTGRHWRPATGRDLQLPAHETARVSSRSRALPHPACRPGPPSRSRQALLPRLMQRRPAAPRLH